MKILVISLAGIGDTLFATPLVHELRLNFPDATIDVLVRWHGSAFLENNPHLNTVYQRNLAADWLGSARFLSGLRRECYDVSINTFPQSKRHYRVVARFVNARTRVSHDYDCSGALDRWLVPKSIPLDYSRHAVEINLALLPLVGATPRLAPHQYEIFLTDAEKNWADEFVRVNTLSHDRLLGIHVGSGATKNLALRRWPLSCYIELARRLRKTAPDVTVLFFGGPEEKSDHEKIRSALGGNQVVFPQTGSIRQAAALIGKCSAFLSVDTSLMHVAAAMKVPGQVVIETPTWNKPIEPYANPFTLVPNPAVAGRNLDFYRYDGGDIKGAPETIIAAMESVTVEKVLATVMQSL